MKKIPILILCLLILIGCGKSTDEKISDSIDRANTLLTTRQCGEAISLLEGLGRQTSNARYIVALASAYACRASYSSITFFGTDIAQTTSDTAAISTTASTLGGMTLYTLSDDTITPSFYEDENVSDIQTAIDILLYAGGAISSTTEPTFAERLNVYGADNGDVNSFAVYLIMTQLGKFIRYYGDGNSTADKGGGSGTNTCFTNYANALPAIQPSGATAAVTGVCQSTNGGHAELVVADATIRKQRLCQGVVLFNNLIELLPLVIADAAGTDLADISAVTTAISTLKTTLQTNVPGIGNVLTVQSQENCESDTTITPATLEDYYVSFFETTFK